MRRVGEHNRGFTLIEVLVVLAILVILFALLIVPMISGLNMASSGRRAIRLQDAQRFAVEQIRRDLADAMYIYPTRRIPLPGPDATIGTSDDLAIANTSQIVFVPPARDPGNGRVYEPLRFEVVPNRWPMQALNVRYALLPAVPDRDGDPSNGYQGPRYSEDNPFVLYRMEGRYDYLSGAFWDDRNGNGSWDAGEPESMASTALTPKEGFDIPVSHTVCLTCGAAFTGYKVNYLPDDTRTCTVCGSPYLAFLHRGLLVGGCRVTGEVLKKNALGTIYQARRGNWDGYPGVTQAGDIRSASDPADYVVGRPHPLDATDLVGAASSVDPRILVYTRTPSTTADPREAQPTAPVYDSFAISAPRNPDLHLVYDSQRGQVRFGQEDMVGLNGAEAVPGHVGTPLGSLTVLRVAGYPPKPYAFRVTPLQSASLPTKVVLNSIRVWVSEPSCPRDTDGDTWPDPCVEYKRTSNNHPDEIGLREFWAGIDPFTGDAEIRFNRYRFDDTVNPQRRFAGVDVYYVFRRNFYRVLPPPGDPTAGVHELDDVVKADYTTCEELHISMTLAQVKTADGTELGQQPTQVTDKATMTSVVKVKNLRR